MKQNIACMRKHVELQGFRGLDDQTVADIHYGLRVAPAICMVWAGIGTVLRSPAVLYGLAPFALLGAILPGHPFDVVYRKVVRPIVGGAELPVYPFPRRFACLLATGILAGSASAFMAGWRLTGIGLGAFLVTAAAINVTTGFCVPSFLLRILGFAGRRPSICS